MQQLNQHFKKESIIRLILVLLGLISLRFSMSFGWGFILGGIISKESIDLRTKEGWTLLAVITVIMILAIYFLLELPAIFGYILSTMSYFMLRTLFTHYQNK